MYINSVNLYVKQTYTKSDLFHEEHCLTTLFEAVIVKSLILRNLWHKKEKIKQCFKGKTTFIISKINLDWCLTVVVRSAVNGPHSSQVLWCQHNKVPCRR